MFVCTCFYNYLSAGLQIGKVGKNKTDPNSLHVMEMMTKEEGIFECERGKVRQECGWLPSWMMEFSWM